MHAALRSIPTQLSPTPFSPALPVTLGYMSSHFTKTMLNGLFNGVLREHAARSRLRIVCFGFHSEDPNRGPGDEDQASLLAPGQELVAMKRGEPAHKAAATINSRGVHVLVDLVGALPIGQELASLDILAMRPAAVSVNAQGYHGTTGAAGDVDYNLVDRVVAPPDYAAFYSEALLVLAKGSFHVNAHASEFAQLTPEYVLAACRPDPAEAEAVLPSRGHGDGDARGGGGSVRMMVPHAFYKLSPAVVWVWSALMRGQGGGVRVLRTQHQAQKTKKTLHVFRKQHYRVAVGNLACFLRSAAGEGGREGNGDMLCVGGESVGSEVGGERGQEKEEHQWEREWMRLGLHVEEGSETRGEYMRQLCRGDILLDTPDFNGKIAPVVCVCV